MHELREGRERLALAICGGEDAPGYANAQTVETLEKVARDNANATMAQINRTLAVEAKLEKAVEGLREIASEASVTVHTHNKGGINYTRMYEDWRKLAVKRIDKARDTLAEIEGEKG